MNQTLRMTPRAPAVLMIGLDAADADYIEAHRADLPNISSLIGPRPLTRLAAEPLSGSVWPTFLTETGPARHGVYHHLQWDAEAMRLRRTHPDWVGAVEPFWRDMARAGRRVISFDTPFVFRGPSGGAVEIANWGSHDLVAPFWCGDAAAEEIVRAVAPRHPMGFEAPLRRSRAELARCAADITAGVDLKAEAAVRLMDHAASDLFLIVFGEPHRAGHILWPDADGGGDIPAGALLDVHRAVDGAVGRIVDRAGPEAAVVLFALHGMGPNQSQSHLSEPMLDAAIRAAGLGRKAASFGAVRWLRRTVPAPVQLAIARAAPAAVRDFVVAREVAGGRRWRDTPAFSLEGDLSGYWRANLRGREAEGVVDDAGAFLSAVGAELAKFESPDGARLIERLHYPARDWPGPRAHLLPDIVAEWNPDLPGLPEAIHPSGARVAGRRATGRTGNHRFRGFYAVRAPSGAHPPLGHIRELGGLARSLLGLASAPGGRP